MMFLLLNFVVKLEYKSQRFISAQMQKNVKIGAIQLLFKLMRGCIYRLRTVLEFEVASLDLGKYWKAKNNGERKLVR